MISIEKLQIEINQLKSSSDNNTCQTCECLQGFVAQLMLDAPKEFSSLVKPLKTAREHMHLCLGCNPCPPADQFAEYMQRKTG